MPNAAPAEPVEHFQHRASVILPGTRLAPRMARSWTNGLLAEELPTQLDDAVLLVCEVVTNAVRYGQRGKGTIGVLRREHTLTFTVVNKGSRRRPAMSTPTTQDEQGRGLQILDALADDWGSRQAAGKTTVWFTLHTV